MKRRSSVLGAALVLWGCGADESSSKSERRLDAHYALASVVFGDDTDMTYISLVSSLDSPEIDLGAALEVSGRASVAAYGGWLFVGDGERPVITRYFIGPGGTFVEDGVLSFENQGLGDWGLYIDDWGNTFVSAHKAYLSNSSDATIVWDPTELAIVARIEQPELARDEPLTFDGSPGIVRGNRLYRTFFWKNWDEYETYAEQYLAVFDVEHDELIELVPETRCPGLNNNVSADEEGNIYFSNWVYNVTETLGRGAPKSCALRLNAGEDRFDEDWKLTFSELAEGREGAALSYVRDGHGVFAVFHHENVTIDGETDLQELALSDNWRLWSVDLERRVAAPLEGVDWLAGGYAVVHVDSRTFLMLPSADYASTRVQELSPDGRVSDRFEVPGDSYQILAF